VIPPADKHGAAPLSQSTDLREPRNEISLIWIIIGFAAIAVLSWQATINRGRITTAEELMETVPSAGAQPAAPKPLI
jgi:hypothetical protein